MAWELIHTFDVVTVPVAKGRPRFTKKGFTYTPAKTRHAENDIRVLVQNAIQGKNPIQGPVKLEIEIRIPRPKSHSKKQRRLDDGWHTKRPDLDNLEKLFMDAANGILWRDDAQVCDKHGMKRYVDTLHESPAGPGYQVRVFELKTVQL